MYHNVSQYQALLGYLPYHKCESLGFLSIGGEGKMADITEDKTHPNMEWYINSFTCLWSYFLKAWQAALLTQGEFELLIWDTI